MVSYAPHLLSIHNNGYLHFSYGVLSTDTLADALADVLVGSDLLPSPKVLTRPRS